ncbi:uncharacterized protein K489DRAFT_362142 [Dissoconium aciculare CBS 342.82]|uniref:Heterokaryon incompatibility domain-containing protein n=1 Tax=Dissoconium aciculare CBS 342.82 TaxID=1314786 RepID=A0A6J3LWN3_9PEZI|nr:uncharacterized protein K489DRAFT_362142 [Dissoconium aciculare CBS 342.82]KAF1819699.1 hypothetical protein K489DRAFT_362142 [Dissoconium aciculare CBS 342.82]
MDFCRIPSPLLAVRSAEHYCSLVRDMRLLNIDTFSFTEYFGTIPPPYAIASHRWTAGAEAMWEDVHEQKKTDTVGYRKVQGFVAYLKAHLPLVKWLWVDTCCIKQHADRELSTAINSMFQWYRDAEVCLAYLEDVPSVSDMAVFEQSVWFRRGWTLQELVAPRVVIFLSSQWEVIGHKGQGGQGRSGMSMQTGPALEDVISTVTAIPREILHDYRESESLTAEEKMRWADGRETMWGEDLSYCLLGIMGVSMNIRYGDGKDKTRGRLLHKIAKRKGEAVPGEFSLPFSLQGIPATDYFVPRKVEMQHLSEFFATTSTQSAQQRVFVVYGTGGMGKTQLCAKFSETNVERFSAVFWLDGSSKDALRRSMASAGSRVSTRTNALSAEMDIAQLIDDFRQWLSLSGNAHWLMVIDNIDRDWQGKTKDEQAYDYREFLPHAYHGNILITTRLRRLQRPKASLHLDTADDELAKEMVETRANRAVTNIDQLLPKLGGLPLALAQAGAYLSTTGMSVADYLEHYDATWAELMQKQDQFPLQEYGERSVLTTWTMSYEQVKSRDPLAAQLLDLWAFLYHGDVWAELLLTGQSDEAQHRPREDAVFRPVTKLSLQHSIGTLVQYSMVKMSTADRAPAIHPVVHAWCLHSLDRSTAQQLQAAALRLVARMAESAGRGVAKDLGLRLAAHAKVIGTRVATWRSDEAQQALEYHQVAHFLKDWETSQEVENLYMRALRGYEKAWGAEHTSTLDTVNSLGLLYADQGKMAEAEEMYLRALRGYEKVWGAEHTSTLDTVNNLGLLYASQGKMAEAEEMYLRALRGYEKAWGAEHTSTLDTVNNLGLLYASQGKMAEAEETYMRALRGYEKLSWIPPDRIESVRQSLSSLRQRPSRLHNEQARESISHVDDGCAIPSKTSPKRGSRERPAALSKLIRKMWKRS